MLAQKVSAQWFVPLLTGVLSYKEKGHRDWERGRKAGEKLS